MLPVFFTKQKMQRPSWNIIVESAAAIAICSAFICINKLIQNGKLIQIQGFTRLYMR